MPFRVAFIPVEFPLSSETIIVRDATDADVDEWERTWRVALRFQDGGTRPDALWDWRREIDRALRSEGFLCSAAISKGRARLEGLMSLSIAPSRIVAGGSVVYVEYVGAAPWNQAGLVGTPEIRGIGSLLLKYAQVASTEIGLGARIGLHAKPEVEAFYRGRFGLKDLGPEVTEDGTWVYFES